MNKLKLFLSFLLLLIFACDSKEEAIKEVKFWKYSEGTLFLDILSFNNKDYRVKNDTIFKLNIPLYRIESHKQRFLAGDQVLQIKDLKNGQTAKYVSK